MITEVNKVLSTIQSHNGEFAEIKNPSYIYPPLEYYPLANRITKVNEIMAVLMDMDGTTTTTEVLCIHSLEMMVRRMSGKLSNDQWVGVDHKADLPYIIGNSTTKHVEYLLNKYNELLIPAKVAEEFLVAANWTIQHGKDEQRKKEVVQNLKKLGLTEVLHGLMEKSATELIQFCEGKIQISSFTTLVSLGIDIYYENYHRILALLKEGKTSHVRKMVFGEHASGEHLISPMPGIPVLIPLLKGWLGNEAGVMADILANDYQKSTGLVPDHIKRQEFKQKLTEYGVLFEKHPVKLGLVTSSIFYEADIVIREVLSVISEIISRSNLSKGRKEYILTRVQNYHDVYDAFVTASDSSEIRLKPHRDLYSIALHKAGVMPGDFDKVIGFEDSESGTIAIRAAGIGCCIAVPFMQTLSHDLGAASFVLKGGIPEALTEYGLFMKNM